MANVIFNTTKKNVSTAERWLATVAGLALAAYGLKKRSKTGLLSAAAGGGLLYCGLSGHSFLYEAFGINRAERTHNPIVSVPHGEGIKIEQTVTIDRTPQELYRFWRNLGNLPLVMKHLESVTVLNDRRSHWVAKAPAGQVVEWDAVVHNDLPNELIAWRSVDGSEVDHAGSVEFKENPFGGTNLKVVINFKPLAGKVGAIIAILLGEDPAHQIEEDLKEFKSMIESTPIASANRPRSSHL